MNNYPLVRLSFFVAGLLVPASIFFYDNTLELILVKRWIALYSKIIILFSFLEQKDLSEVYFDPTIGRYVLVKRKKIDSQNDVDNKVDDKTPTSSDNNVEKETVAVAELDNSSTKQKISSSIDE